MIRLAKWGEEDALVSVAVRCIGNCCGETKAAQKQVREEVKGM
jgi:hypothetical protein